MFDDRPLHHIFRDVVKQCADHPAVISAGGVMDYKTLDAQSDRLAANLAAQGIQKGDRIGLYCINCAEFAVAYYGIIKAGAVVVPLNLLLNPKEIIYILSDSGARGLIYHVLFAEAVSAIKAELPDVELLLEIMPDTNADWSKCLNSDAAVPQPAMNTHDDLAVIIYTSGTTGKPKGAMLTHRNLAANVWSVRKAFDLQPGKDRFLTVLPMFHAFAGTVGMHTPLLSGAAFVPVPRFDAALIAETIQKTNATIFLGVPSMYNMLLRLPDSAIPQLSSLRFCVAGGAAMPVELLKQFEEKFGKVIYEGDGPSECSPVTSVNPIGGKTKAGSVGHCVPLVEMKIMDANGNELPNGEVGEICVRGPNIMKGYWKREQETKECFFGDWFRTGDLGHRDDEDYFFIVDRIKDLIISGGMNVYPRVIEEVLYQHEAVREAAVIGEPDDLRGEIPIAYIELKDGMKASNNNIRSFCREHLGHHEIPKKVVFMDELPKNATGKILKRALRKQGEIERGIKA